MLRWGYMTTRPLGRTGLTVSSLGLGTVEIGLPYGIGVKNLPTEPEAERILKTAVELGVTYFDTARGYGVAEERIGKSRIGQLPGIVIGTKCGQWLKQEPDLHGIELAKRIRADIDTSRSTLHQEQLQLVQLHNELPDFTDFRELIEILQQLKDEGKVAHVGVATRGEVAAQAAIATDFFETLQVAYSLLDQRMGRARESILQLARQKNIGVINRSVLLKGALTGAYTKLPPPLTPLKTNAAQAAALAAELGTDLPSLALRFAASHPAISTILIGTIAPTHLTTALAALAAGPLPTEVLTKLHPLGIDDPRQVDPVQWPPL